MSGTVVSALAVLTSSVFVPGGGTGSGGAEGKDATHDAINMRGTSMPCPRGLVAADDWDRQVEEHEIVMELKESLEQERRRCVVLPSMAAALPFMAAALALTAAMLTSMAVAVRSCCALSS
eukprot:2461759-Rhodomonas_salina.4